MAEYGGSFFKTLRGRRYLHYAYRGFLPFECFAFSKVPLSVPYTKRMMADRLKQYKWAFKEKWSKSRWEAYIKKDIYGGDLDPWRFLRQYEMAWREGASPNDPYLLEQQKKRSEQKAKYRALNRRRINEKKTEYRRLNRDKINRYARSYRLKKKQERMNG